MPKREMDLSGTWMAAPVSRFHGDYRSLNDWKEVQVPGHWQQNPEYEFYAGKMVYKKSFKFMPYGRERVFLRVGGAFYWSTVYVNGARLGENEGYFFPTYYECTGLLAKDNEMIVELDCPEEPDKSAKRQLTGVFHHWDCLDPMTNPGGLWLPVEVVESGPAAIFDPFFYTAYLGKDNKSARIMGRVTLDTPAPADLKIKISFMPKTFEGETRTFEYEVQKSAGAKTYHYNLDLPEPVLWWAAGHGRPDLYTLKVEVFEAGKDVPSDLWESDFGVRTFEMRDYIAYLNGRRMYIRGNNYPPGDTRLAVMDRERCLRDVQLALDCNLNMLRVHAHVDHPEFYRACDEKGLLLWQDFPMQWYYRPEVAGQAARQLEKMILHLGNHPSVALWCMHNEPIRAPDMKKFIGPIKAARAVFSMLVWNANRDRMDVALARQARSLDPHRPAYRCSGERGLFRENGDVHYYYGWYFGPLHWFHKKYKKHPDRLRFVTEFGSQSLPNLESAVKFMDPDIRKVDWKHLEKRHHLQHPLLKLFVNHKRFDNLADFIQATQDYQGELNRYYIDRFRALKYKPNGGCIAFVLLDSNPAIQWSVIDYWRVPKSSYHRMKDACSPVYAFTLLEKNKYKRGAAISLPVYAVNDAWEEVRADLGLKVVSPVGETVIDEQYSETLAADCMATIVANPKVKLRWEGTYQVRISLQADGNGFENEYRLKVK